MYCEYLELYSPKMLFPTNMASIILLFLLPAWQWLLLFFWPLPSWFVVRLSKQCPLCPGQTSDISGFPKENSGKCVWFGPVGHPGQYQHLPHFLNISQHSSPWVVPLHSLQVKSCHGFSCLPWYRTLLFNCPGEGNIFLFAY